MSFQRGIDGAEPARDPVTGQAGHLHEERRVAPAGRVAVGTLACPRCDAPVALSFGPVAPADALRCPFCSHRAAAREFLSLALPTRPARVVVRVRERVRFRRVTR